MGNSRSRVAPSRTFRVFDSQTRARYRNQRESLQLRHRLQEIQNEHNQFLTQLTLDRHELKKNLRTLQHETEQRVFFQKFDQPVRKSSASSSTAESPQNEPEPSDSSALLLHDLVERKKWQKTRFLLHRSKTPVQPVQPSVWSDFERRRLEYTSKLNSDQAQKNLTLQQQADLMKTTVRIAVARAARNSNVTARRSARLV